MKKLAVILSILAMVAMFAWKAYQPWREQKARQNALLQTSDAGNLSRIVRVWGDDWLGYLIFRSRYFQRQLGQERLGVRYEMAPDFKERFKGLASGECDFAMATVDSYLTNAQELGYPGVIAWVVDESFGADAIIGAPGVKSLDALNNEKVRGAFVGCSPSEFLLKAQVAAFHLNALLPKIAGFRMDKEESAYAALARGKADFAVLWEPFTSQALHDIPGTVRLLDSGNTKGLIVDVAVVARKLLATDPDLVEKVARAYFLSLDYYLQHADEFRELAGADSRKDIGTATTMLNGIKFASFTENVQRWFPVSGQNAMAEEGVIDSINAVSRILADVGDVKGDPLGGNPYSIINSTVLKAVAKAPGALAADAPRLAKPAPTADQPFFRALTGEEWQRVSARVVGTLVDEPILFENGSSGIPEEFQAVLRDAVYKLAHYPKYRLIVDGYVSPGSDPAADQALSGERAASIKRFLVEDGGVQEERIHAVGKGATDLPARGEDESDAAWKRRCRRARIFFVQE